MLTVPSNFLFFFESISCRLLNFHHTILFFFLLFMLVLISGSQRFPLAFFVYLIWELVRPFVFSYHGFCFSRAWLLRMRMEGTVRQLEFLQTFIWFCIDLNFYCFSFSYIWQNRWFLRCCF